MYYVQTYMVGMCKEKQMMTLYHSLKNINIKTLTARTPFRMRCHVKNLNFTEMVDFNFINKNKYIVLPY